MNRTGLFAFNRLDLTDPDFRRRRVPTVPFATHARGDAMCGEHVLVVRRSVLAAAIGAEPLRLAERVDDLNLQG